MFGFVEEPIRSKTNLNSWKYLKDGTDLYYLSRAVARHETAGCRLGYGKTHNNCHGILSNGKPILFETEADSHKYFYGLWKNYYKEFPDDRLARRYSGNDRSEAWLKNVTFYYNKYKNS